MKSIFPLIKLKDEMYEGRQHGAHSVEVAVNPVILLHSWEGSLAGLQTVIKGTAGNAACAPQTSSKSKSFTILLYWP